MSLNEKVLNILEDICETDVVREDLDIRLFEEGLIDSFGTVNLLVLVEEQLGITLGISDFDREQWATPNKIISLLENWE